MEDTRLPKCVMFGEMVGGAGCVEGQQKEWMGCFLDDLGAFGINADQWTTAAQDEGEWRRTAKRGAEHFMMKLIAAEKTKAGLRHAVVCPNVTGRTKKRIAQSKRARAGSLALVETRHKWRELVSSGRLVCRRCHAVFSLVLRLFCFASFFRAFVEAAALRSNVLRYAGVPIAITCFSLFLFFFICRFFRVLFLYHFRFLSVWQYYRVRRTFFPSGWYFFYLVTTGWIFDISLLCENSINQSNQSRDTGIHMKVGDEQMADHTKK